MKLSELEKVLNEVDTITILKPDGGFVPQHFHVTEVGLITKNYIDCGGTLRDEVRIGMQLWEADDYDHRLSPDKLRSIIDLSKDKLGLPDADIEVEYQGDTIGKYNLDFDGHYFHLRTTVTDCLAKDKCGVPVEKKKVSLRELSAKTESAGCTTGSGCC